MDDTGFASWRSNRKQNSKKNCYVLQCICAEVQEVFPGTPTQFRRGSIRTLCESHPCIPHMSPFGVSRLSGGEHQFAADS